jgi:carboxypeptidase family protein
MPFRVVPSLIFCAGLSYAQTAPTTSLSGSVVDASGGAIANAALELTNTATHFTKRGTSDSQGRYLFNLVPPGVYDLTASSPGGGCEPPDPTASQQVTVTADAPMPQLAQQSRWLRLPFGGWQMSGIWSWRSGTPFNVTSGQDRSFSGVGLDRADIIVDPFLSGDRSTDQKLNQYFNTAAYTLNAPGTFGNAPRNLLRGFAFFNVDYSLQKTFTATERFRFDLRGDFFNVFNNVHFNAPGGSVSSTSTFGKISGAGDPRILQVAVRVHF